MITCSFGQKYKTSLRHVVVDMLVIRGKKIILVKRGADYLEPNKWALPGGYMEKGETAGQAAVRETLEETGYKTEVSKLLQIVDSPKRRHETRQNVSLVYLMKVVQRIGGFDEEISEIKWFDFADLPPVKNMAFDHLEMIRLYKIHLKKRFLLPIMNMNHKDIESWEETLDIMSNPKLVADLKKSQLEFKQGKFISHEKLLKDLGLNKKSPGSV